MTLTEWFLLGTVLGWVTFDVWIAMRKGAQETISVVLWQLSVKYPPIPFAVGVLVGHIFFNMVGIGCG